MELWSSLCKPCGSTMLRMLLLYLFQKYFLLLFCLFHLPLIPYIVQICVPVFHLFHHIFCISFHLMLWQFPLNFIILVLAANIAEHSFLDSVSIYILCSFASVPFCFPFSRYFTFVVSLFSLFSFLFLFLWLYFHIFPFPSFTHIVGIYVMERILQVPQSTPYDAMIIETGILDTQTLITDMKQIKTTREEGRDNKITREKQQMQNINYK